MLASDFPTKRIALLAVFSATIALTARAIQIVDEDGEPIAKYEWMLNTSDQGCSRWVHDGNGRAELAMFRDAKVVDMLVRADGYANTIERFAGEKLAAFTDPDRKVILKRGEPVELRLETAEGVELPDDLRPDVYFADIEWRASIMRQPMNRTHYAKDASELDFNMLIKPAGKGKFELRLAKDTPPFYVGIHQEGFLRFFEAGPFTMADVKEGVLTVMVPKPARLDLNFDLSKANEDELPNGRQFELSMKQRGGSGAYLQVVHEVRPPGKDASLSITDLVPGEYRYAVSVDPERGSHPVERDEVQPWGFREIGFVSLGEGDTKAVEVKYVPVDLSVTQGDRAATVHILKPNKEPATGKKAVIYYVDEHYGRLPVFSGDVPANGQIALDKVAQGDKKALKSLGSTGYGVLVDGEPLGHFDFADDEKQKDVSFWLPVGVGDEAPDVEMIDINTSKHSRLSELHGKYVWLEFWATWCGPCQPAMAELVKTYGEHRGEWAGKIVVVPISVDETPDVVIQHTKDRAWDVFPHYWSDRTEEKMNFSSSAASQFGVHGVPTAFLIAPDGKIAWTGHPASAAGNGISLAEFIKSHAEE